MSRFVGPHSDTLTLDNGDTLTVRRRLNMGEQRESVHACREVAPDGSVTFDTTKLGLAKVAAYLLDWRLTEAPPLRQPDGRPIALEDRIAVLDNLDPADFAELKDAIDAHEQRQIAARLEEKKRAATTNAAPTTRSPFAAAGTSTGSAN